MTHHRWASMWFCFCLMTIYAGFPAHAQVMPEGFAAKRNGTIQVQGIAVTPVYYDAQWVRGRLSVDPGYAGLNNIAASLWQFPATIQTPQGVTISMDNRITTLAGATGIRWQIDAKAAQPVTTKTVSLNIDLPLDAYADRQIIIDGTSLTLPKVHAGAKPLFIREAGIKRLEIPTSAGPVVFCGQWGCVVQDNRAWSGSSYTIRLYFHPHQGTIQQTSMDVTITTQAFHSQTVDLRPAANMGFADEKDGDARGGWTDQGPANDLSTIKPGRHRFGRLDFDIIDPAKNQGKSCIMMAGPARPYFAQRTAPLAVAADRYRRLYVLHSCAWTPKQEIAVGQIVARYQDGSEQTLDVVAQRDLGDWWKAHHRPNGVVVWSAPNASHYVGVYLSTYALQDKPLKSLELVSTHQGVWGVLAMTLSRDDAPLPDANRTTLFINADDQWKPLTTFQDVVPQSVLDLSDLIEPGPAGQHGRLKAVHGKLEYEGRPGQPVRLMGANVCFSACFMPKEESARLAVRLRQMGYNLVRLQAYDEMLQKRDAKSNDDFDPQQLDRLEYLIACLKEQGIYITMDMFIGRRFFPDETPFGQTYPRHAYGLVKNLLMIGDRQAMQAWRAFAQKLLTHRNPYTGMSLAQDPALASISSINEEFTLVTWNHYPQVAELYRQAYLQWLQQQSMDLTNHSLASPTFTRFLVEKSFRSHQQMKAWLRDMGYQGMYTGDNADAFAVGSLIRDAFDLVDNHFYHDHPAFGGTGDWSMPYIFTNISATKQQLSAIRRMFATRTLGKPMAITEFSFCLPNTHRGESGPIVGAYASLQGWDLLNRFDWGYEVPRLTEPTIAYRFDMANDPINRLADHIIGYFYTRGDVASAKHRIGYWISPASHYVKTADRSEAPLPLSQLGLVTAVGAVTPTSLAAGQAQGLSAILANESIQPATDSTLWLNQPADYHRDLVTQGILPDDLMDLNAQRFVSDTGQIELNASAGTFRVVTPKSEAVVLAQAGSHQADRLKVIDSTTHGTFFIACKDDLPLARSKRMVFFHLTDVLNTQMKFEDQDRRALADWGKLPHLVLKGQAKIELRLPQPQEIQVWQVDLSGKRVALLECPAKEDRLVIPVSTVSPKGNTLVYELIRP